MEFEGLSPFYFDIDKIDEEILTLNDRLQFLKWDFSMLFPEKLDLDDERQ